MSVLIALLAMAGCSSTNTSTGTGGAPQVVSRPNLGFAVELPADWTEDVEQTPGAVYYARSTPTRSWLHVFKGQTDLTLEQTMTNVVEGLQKQGAQDFSQRPVDVGGTPGIRLDYRASDGPPGSGLVLHSSYRVKRASTVFSLALATTDEATQQTVLDRIATSFRLL